MRISLLISLIILFYQFPIFSDEIGRFKKINLDTNFNDIERKKIFGKDCAKFEGVASISRAIENAIRIDKKIVGMYKVIITFEEFSFFGNHCIYVEGYPRYINEEIK